MSTLTPFLLKMHLFCFFYAFFVFLLFKNLFYVFNSLNLKGNSFLPAQLLFVRSCLLLCTLLFCFYILYPFISISFYFNFRKSAQCSNFTIRRITIKKQNSISDQPPIESLHSGEGKTQLPTLKRIRDSSGIYFLL